MTNQINLANFFFKKPSLEDQYADLIFQDVNFDQDCGFQDYHRTVNEWPPENIQPHLHQTVPGATVVTGGERLFFDLILSDEKFCIGMIGRDINPKAKAYIDFNVLLLRISENMKEYAILSEPIAWWEKSYNNILAKRIKKITEKTEKSDLPQRVKNYYLKHMQKFGSVYLHLGKECDWRKNAELRACYYHQNEEQFSKLQQYAKAGNIIATCGNINDLKFLKDTQINIVDTSNIHDYCVVNLQGEGDFSPRVIWTELSIGPTKYYSAPYVYHEPLNAQEEKEFQSLIDLFQKTHSKDVGKRHYFQILTEKLKLEDSSLRDDPQDVFKKLKNSMRSVIKNPDQRIIHDPTLGYLPLSDINTLNNLFPEHFHHLCRHPQIAQHLPFLLENISELKPAYYLQLLKISGAKEELEKQSLQRKIDLRNLVSIMTRHNLLNLFTQEIGLFRLTALKIRIALGHLSTPVKAEIFLAGAVLVMGGYWTLRSIWPRLSQSRLLPFEQI